MKISETVTVEDRSVAILGGMCESADRCGIATCKFYDVSPAGNARYLVALRRSHTLEGLLEEKRRH
jgi:hypothetical protein